MLIFPLLTSLPIIVPEGKLEKGTISCSWFKNQTLTLWKFSCFTGKWKSGPVSASLPDIQEVPQWIKCSYIIKCGRKGTWYFSSVCCVTATWLMQGSWGKGLVWQCVKATREGVQPPYDNGISSRERVPGVESKHSTDQLCDLSKTYRFPHL